MNKIKIENKFIGKNNPVFIIAEVGVNHNGDINLAKKLIDVAKEVGSDAVKFQTFKSENLVSKNTEMVEYQKKNVGIKETQQEMLKRLELSYDDFIELKKYCDKKDIIFLSTPHSEDAIDFLDLLVPAYKIASGDLTNLPFLEKVMMKGKPIILSTGMSTIQEVKEALEIIYKEGNKQVIALHCTTNYPCPLEEVNLRAMQTMQQELDCFIGYSDHTMSIKVPIIAVSLGAVLIEKHFTLDRNLPGPDHKASLEPNELKNMIDEIRRGERELSMGIKWNDLKIIKENQDLLTKILGTSEKKPIPSEEKIKKLVRKSIIARIDIPTGTVVTEDMLTIKRPGTGIEPKYFKKIIGKGVKESIRKDEVILWEKME